ncbi:MAG: hypothetical protein IKL52_03745, partial [Candidatus Gastranaerophilales bacterium]|nr:hypothetical protein [Candidatus Gastranaerophilales bacterium]
MKNVAQNINKLFATQTKFAPFAFDNNGKIIESIRQDLLAKSQAICLKILKQFEALEITNIYLAGSTASYLWRDDSDFDVWIKLKIDYDKFFIKNPNKAIEFLRSYFRAEYNQNKYHCKIGDKKIDIVLNVSIPQKLYGLYDLVNNKWLRKPSQNLLKGQNPKKICNKAIKKFAQIKNEIANLKRNKDDQIAIGTISRLHNKHAKIVKSQYTGVEDYLIFKLLRY